LLTKAGIDAASADANVDPGLIIVDDADDAWHRFLAAIAQHRVWARQEDPPRV
jgi:catalase